MADLITGKSPKELLADLQRNNAEFFSRTRYVVHGKPGTYFAGEAVGIGITPEDGPYVNLYNDRADAEERLKEFVADWKRNTGKDCSDWLYIKEVNGDELSTTYLKANII